MLGFAASSPLRVARVRFNGRPRSNSVGATMCVAVPSKDAMEFFQHRVGRWRSRRVTHHLAFRRAESGESVITMGVLEPTDERIVALCEMHKVDPSEASGGCHVTWQATMSWDQEGENHTGETVFAIVPDADNPRKGRMLRDRGYAEVVPVAGRFEMTEDDELSLSTPYEGGAVEEVFAFDDINVCNRVSSVKRFGGIATATFSTETRLDVEEEQNDVSKQEFDKILDDHLVFGTNSEGGSGQKPLESNFLQGSRARFNQAAARQKAGAPSANSAFGSGFSSAPSANSAFATGFGGNGVEKSVDPSEEKNSATAVSSAEDVVEEAARKAGIDLSKVPPSMRAEFIASLEKDLK